MKNKVIVVYSTNRDKKFQESFDKEISKSIGCPYGILTIDNDGSIPLTHAYNNAWNVCQWECTGVLKFSEIVMVFIHHDIHFKNQGWGKTILNLFNHSDADIIGVAGTDTLYDHGAWWINNSNEFNQHDLWGKVWHTDGKKEWKSNFTTERRNCKKLQPVVTVDGLFIAVNPDTCDMFDPEFDGFHFYDISFCVKNLTLGKKIYVTETIPIVHESGGVLSEAWEANRIKFLQKYNYSYPLRNL